MRTPVSRPRLCRVRNVSCAGSIRQFYRIRSVCGILLLALAGIVSCAGGTDPGGPEEFGTIEIRARIVNPPSQGKGAHESAAQATEADRLVIEVSGDDLAPVRKESGRLDFSRPTLSETFTTVPVGRNRRIEVFAIDRNDRVTHIDTVLVHTADLTIGTVTSIVAVLIPAAGSIYLQFLELPSNTSVYARFASNDGDFAVEGSAARGSSPRTFMSLDNIPHETDGVLTAVVTGTGGDTLYIASRGLLFDARSDNSVDLHFVTYNGALALDVTVQTPGVTLVSSDFSSGSPVADVEETGELIITEIMWNATNDNYIEVHNPGGEALFFEVLTTDVNGTLRDFDNVSIGPGAYFVIGRRAMPHANVSTASTSGLPVTTAGNWISVRRGRTGPILDRVIFAAGTSNAIGWPALSTSNNRSIELSRDRYDVIENNFGKNWSVTAAAEPLPGMASVQYGTPGR